MIANIVSFRLGEFFEKSRFCLQCQCEGREGVELEERSSNRVTERLKSSQAFYTCPHGHTAIADLASLRVAAINVSIKELKAAQVIGISDFLDRSKHPDVPGPERIKELFEETTPAGQTRNPQRGGQLRAQSH